MIVRSLLFTIFFALCFVGCNEDSDSIVNSPQSDKNSLQDLQVFVQEFVISKDSSITIKGVQGTLLSFSPNSFVHQDSSIVKDSITIELQEYYNVADILFNELTTETIDKQLLATNGMIHIKVLSEGKELVLKEGENYEIGFPINQAEKEKGYYLFNGQYDEDTKCTKWEESIVEFDDTDFGKGNYLDTIGIDLSKISISLERSLDYYLFSSTNLGWLNCDKYLNDDIENKSFLLANVPLDLKPIVRLVYKPFKTLSSGVVTGEGYRYDPLMLGAEVTLFGFGKVGKKIYLGQKDLVIAEDMEIDLEFKEVTLEELKAAAEALEWESI